jgi:hypothetical protein
MDRIKMNIPPHPSLLPRGEKGILSLLLNSSLELLCVLCVFAVRGS